MLRRIAYVSTAQVDYSMGVPEDLARIVMWGRKYNQNNHVTALLSYKNGFYIQIIEGETHLITDLFRRIQSDARHSDVVPFLDAEGDDRLFRNWALKLSTSASISHSFKSLIDRHWSSIENLAPHVVDRIKVFHDPGESNSKHQGFPDDSELHNFEFRLTGFPSIRRSTELSQDFLEICARLNRAWLPYKDLCELNSYSESQVGEVLRDFQQSGLLKFRACQSKAEPSETHDTKRTTAGVTVYDKFRNFFRRSM